MILCEFYTTVKKNNYYRMKNFKFTDSSEIRLPSGIHRKCSVQPRNNYFRLRQAVLVSWMWGCAAIGQAQSDLYQHVNTFPGDPGQTVGTAVQLDSSSLLFLLAGATMALRVYMPYRKKKE